MNEHKWTKRRKDLCNEFWDHCAQESCDIPCSRILEAEKAVDVDVLVHLDPTDAEGEP